MQISITVSWMSYRELNLAASHDVIQEGVHFDDLSGEITLIKTVVMNCSWGMKRQIDSGYCLGGRSASLTGSNWLSA